MHDMVAKVVQCGDVWELVLYEKPVACGFTVHREKKEKSVEISSVDDIVELNEDDKRLDNLARARKNIRQIILCNQTRYTKFFTLTYANTVLDIDTVTHDFNMFIKNMKRKGFNNLPYLYVVENQKERGKKEGNKGSLHIHCLIFSDEYFPYSIVKKCWGKRGSVDVTAVEDIHNLGAYVSKYISKDFEKEKDGKVYCCSTVELGKHLYRVSKGLNRPIEKRLYSDGGHDQGLHVNGVSLDDDLKEFINSLDVYYQSETQFSYTIKDEEIIQRVKYIQGRRKRCKN